MIHTYIRFCYRASDGKTFRETTDISGEEVAMRLTGRRAGNRADFLELLNNWNRVALRGAEAGSGYIYTYVAD